MKSIFLMSDFLGQVIILILMVSPIVFVAGLIMLAFSKSRKLGIKFIIGAVIAFIIGFGTCLASVNLGAMH